MRRAELHSHHLFSQILWGIGLGIVAGIVFGEAIRPLGLVASGFIRLLQVNVLPYLLGSLIASLGSRESAEMKVVARYGTLLLLLVWGLGLLLVLMTPLALPPFSGLATFGLESEPPPIDWLDLYIPANLFHALTNNLIPAVVLFGILTGIALGQMSDASKATLLDTLHAFNEAMTRVSRIVLKLTPYGLFAIAAVTAGEMRLVDLLRLQIWFVVYAGATLIFTLWVLPSLVVRLTPVHYGRFLLGMRNAIVTAAAAGDVLVVLPLISEAAKALLLERGADPEKTDRAVSIAVPLLYNFPHVGKILSLAFVPFAAWYSGTALDVERVALLVSAGPLSLFGNINAAMPFLLDLTHLPADLFELFTVSSILNTHLGAMTAATHTAALSILVAAAMLGSLHFTTARTLRVAAASAALMLAFVTLTRVVFTWMLPPTPSGLTALSSFELRPPLVDIVASPPDEAPQPPAQGDRLRVIRERGVLRVGYFVDSIPWAFVNAEGKLVGYDVEAAHRLAGELGVKVEFVRVRNEPPGPSKELSSGRVDILMTGLTATVGRAERMELSQPYNREHVAFIVRDFDRRRFESLATLNDGRDIVVAVPPVDGAVERLKAVLPQATTRPYVAVSEALRDQQVTAVLTTLERAFYWSRVQPEFAAVRPREISVDTVVVYGVPAGEHDLKNIVDLWIETRQASGDAQSAYDYWVLGKALTPHVPRWSVIRDVFGWR